MSYRVSARALQIAATIACVGAALLVVPLSDLWAALQRADPVLAVAIFALVPLAIALRALRWRHIVAQQNVFVTAGDAFRICLVGHAYNLVLPASAGDVARSYNAWKLFGQKEVMLTSTLVDKLVGVFVLCILGMISSAIIANATMFVSSTILAAVFAAPILAPRIVPWRLAAASFRKLLSIDMNRDLLLETSRLSASAIAVTVAYSVLGWTVTNLIYLLSWHTFTSDVTLFYAFAIAPLINLMRMLPATISGVGSTELLVVLLFSMAGLGESEALMGSLLATLALVILPGLAGCWPLIAETRGPVHGVPWSARDE